MTALRGRAIRSDRVGRFGPRDIAGRGFALATRNADGEILGHAIAIGKRLLEVAAQPDGVIPEALLVFQAVPVSDRPAARVALVCALDDMADDAFPARAHLVQLSLCPFETRRSLRSYLALGKWSVDSFRSTLSEDLGPPV